MRISIMPLILLAGITACDSPPATQPEDFDTVNAAAVDPGVAPGALGDESANYSEGSVTPAEQNNMGNSIRSQETPSSGNAQQ
jgi:hypothetical protein